jgi:hypothetical protein
MGFLTKAATEEEESPAAGLEEQYERMFGAIGRDFITRGDFITIMRRMMLFIDPHGQFPVDFSEQSWAVAKAVEYKAVLDSGKDGSKLYKNLIDLDE